MITHELKRIFSSFQVAKEKGLQSVLATVVALDGSSYRRPGVRMLILEDGKMIGAVSGGCVEKEVYRQSLTVFENGIPKIMTYDGRYRLGCEGVLYILLERFDPDQATVEAFWSSIENRNAFSVRSYFDKADGVDSGYGSVIDFGKKGTRPLGEQRPSTKLPYFEQQMPPCFQLVIIGAEHDAVQLCSQASMTGWEVTVIASPKEEKTIQDFPGATGFLNAEGEGFSMTLDGQTAVVLMTHSFVKDLQFLISLRDSSPAYFGILGPLRRREKLFEELLEKCPDVSLDYIEHIHGPAGLDIGAETPQEIAISVLAEILATINQKEPIPLREKEGRIHA